MRLCRTVTLLFSILTSLDAIAKAEETKMVALRMAPATSIPIGEIDLGHISGDESVVVKFLLKNETDREIKVQGVRPSCNCTSLELSQVSLVPSASSTQVGRLQVNRVSGRGNVKIASIALLEDSKKDPVGIILVKAQVDRPFALEKNYYDVTLSADEDTVVKLPISIAQSLAVDEVTLLDESSLTKVELVRKLEKREEGTLIIKGKTKALLEAKVTDLTISATREGHSACTEKLRIRYVDGTKLRIIPSIPSVESGKTSFMVFRTAPIDIENLKVTHQGQVVDAKFKRRTRNVVGVDVVLPNDFASNSLHLTDGSFELSIDLNPNEEKKQ